jgi:hypothetical protein
VRFGNPVAGAIGAPRDVFLVCKLGAPGHEELVTGAVAADGVRVLNVEAVRMLRASDVVIDRMAARERRELARREREYCGGRPPLDGRGKAVILVDDELATGSAMRAAAEQVEHVPGDLPLLIVRDEPDGDGRPVRPEADGFVGTGGPVAGLVEPGTQKLQAAQEAGPEGGPVRGRGPRQHHRVEPAE